MRFRDALFRGEGSIRLMLQELGTIALIMFCVCVFLTGIYVVQP